MFVNRAYLSALRAQRPHKDLAKRCHELLGMTDRIALLQSQGRQP